MDNERFANSIRDRRMPFPRTSKRMHLYRHRIKAVPLCPKMDNDLSIVMADFDGAQLSHSLYGCCLA
jgi:hypothetical protein